MSPSVQCVEARIVMNIRRARHSGSRSSPPSSRDPFRSALRSHATPMATKGSRRSVATLLRPRADHTTDSVAASRTSPRQPKSQIIAGERAEKDPPKTVTWCREQQSSSSNVGRRRAPSVEGNREVAMAAERVSQVADGGIDAFSSEEGSVDTTGIFVGNIEGKYASASENMGQMTAEPTALGSDEYEERRRKRAARGLAVLRKVSEGFEKIDALVEEEKTRLARDLVRRLKAAKAKPMVATAGESAVGERATDHANGNKSASRPVALTVAGRATRTKDVAPKADGLRAGEATDYPFLGRQPWRAGGVGLFSVGQTETPTFEGSHAEERARAACSMDDEGVIRAQARVEINHLVDRVCKDLANRPWRLAGVRLVTDAATRGGRGSGGRPGNGKSHISAFAKDVSDAMSGMSSSRVETLLGKASCAAFAAGHRPAGQRRGGGGGVGRSRRLVRPRTFPTKNTHHRSRPFMPISPPRHTRCSGGPNGDDCVEDKDEARLRKPGMSDQPTPNEEPGFHCGRAGYPIRSTFSGKMHQPCDTTTSERLAREGRCNGAISLPESEHLPDFSSMWSADTTSGSRKSCEKQEKMVVAIDAVDESASMDLRASESSKGHLSWAQGRESCNDQSESSPNRVLPSNGQTLLYTDVDSGCRSPSGKSSGAALSPAERPRRSFFRRRKGGGGGSRLGRTPSPPRRLCFCRSARCGQTEKQPHWNSRFWLPAEQKAKPRQGGRSPSPTQRVRQKLSTDRQHGVNASPTAVEQPILRPAAFTARGRLSVLKRDHVLYEIGRERYPPHIDTQTGGTSGVKGNRGVEIGRSKSAGASPGPADLVHLEPNMAPGDRATHGHLEVGRFRSGEVRKLAKESRDPRLWKLKAFGHESSVEMVVSELCTDHFAQVHTFLSAAEEGVSSLCFENEKRAAETEGAETCRAGPEASTEGIRKEDGRLRQDKVSKPSRSVGADRNDRTTVLVSSGLLVEFLWPPLPTHRGEAKQGVHLTRPRNSPCGSDKPTGGGTNHGFTMLNVGNSAPQAHADGKDGCASDMPLPSQSRYDQATDRNRNTQSSECSRDFLVLTISFVLCLVESAERVGRYPPRNRFGTSTDRSCADRERRSTGYWEYIGESGGRSQNYPPPPQPPTPPWSVIAAALRDIRDAHTQRGTHERLSDVLGPVLLGALVRLIARALQPPHPVVVSQCARHFGEDHGRIYSPTDGHPENGSEMASFLGWAVRDILRNGGTDSGGETFAYRRQEDVGGGNVGNAECGRDYALDIVRRKTSAVENEENWQDLTVPIRDARIMHLSDLTRPDNGTFVGRDGPAGSSPGGGSRITIHHIEVAEHDALHVGLEDSSGGGYCMGTFISEDFSVSSISDGSQEKRRETGKGPVDNRSCGSRANHAAEDFSLLAADVEVGPDSDGSITPGGGCFDTPNDCLPVLAGMQRVNSHLHIPGLAHDARMFARLLGRLAGHSDGDGAGGGGGGFGGQAICPNEHPICSEASREEIVALAFEHGDTLPACRRVLPTSTTTAEEDNTVEPSTNQHQCFLNNQDGSSIIDVVEQRRHRDDGLEGDAYPSGDPYFADVGGEGEGVSDDAIGTVWDMCSSLTAFDVYGDGDTIGSRENYVIAVI